MKNNYSSNSWMCPGTHRHAKSMTSEPAKIGEIILVEISQSGSHDNVNFTDYSQLFDPW